MRIGVPNADERTFRRQSSVVQKTWCGAMTEIQPELAARLLDVARAIDNVLVAGHAQRHWLQPGHPPFRPTETGDRGSDETDLQAAAVANYGGPSAAMELRIM